MSIDLPGEKIWSPGSAPKIHFRNYLLPCTTGTSTAFSYHVQGKAAPVSKCQEQFQPKQDYYQP